MRGNQEQYYQIIFWGTLILSLLVIFIIIFSFAYQKKQKTYLLQKNQFSQTLLQTQLEIQEQTLKNISQEIHDNVGQILSLAKLNLNTIDIAKTEHLQTKIENSLNYVSKAIQDLRDLSRSFNTDTITSIGLIRAVETELDIINKTGLYQTRFITEGTLQKLEPQKELILFRIVQEALHNIIKHAKANSIFVSAVYTPRQLELLVKDNGEGFDLTPLETAGENGFGLGIRNMHNRAKLIGADFSMHSVTGEGTIVTIRLPLENQNPVT